MGIHPPKWCWYSLQENQKLVNLVMKSVDR